MKGISEKFNFTKNFILYSFFFFFKSSWIVIAKNLQPLSNFHSFDRKSKDAKIYIIEINQPSTETNFHLAFVSLIESRICTNCTIYVTQVSKLTETYFLVRSKDLPFLAITQFTTWIHGGVARVTIIRSERTTAAAIN